MTLAEKIKNLREKRKLTQEELGKLLNVTKQTIFKYETGLITNIPMDRIEKLAIVLYTTPAYLMGWQETDTMSANKNEFQYIARGGKTGTLKFKSDEDMQKALKILQTLADEQFGPDKD